MNFKLFVSCCLVAGFILCGCSPKVKRVDPGTQTDLSGRWNETDSRMTSSAMIEQMFAHRWVVDFERRYQKKPVIIVGLVTNRSHEHINTETFIADIERAIINDGSIRLVEAGRRRDELRGERAGQQDFASPETVKRWGNELGADFMLQGTINSIVDSNRRQQSIYYQIDLRLTNIETNETVWMGNKSHKKLI